MTYVARRNDAPKPREEIMRVQKKRSHSTRRTLVALGFGALLVVGCRNHEPPASADQSATPDPNATSGAVTNAPPPATQAPAPEAQPEARAETRPAPKPEPRAEAPRVSPPVTLAVGTTFSATLQTPIATNKNQVGDAVTLQTTDPIMVSGKTVVPTGSVIHGEVTHVRDAGRLKGASELTLRFTELEFPNGKTYPIEAEPYRAVIKGDGKETAAEIGGGAAVGSIIGGVLGGKSGALKGAAIGGAAGTGMAAATKGDQIVLPAGRTLDVQLAAPLTLSRGATS
jgi:hypothetical protein